MLSVQVSTDGARAVYRAVHFLPGGDSVRTLTSAPLGGGSPVVLNTPLHDVLDFARGRLDVARRTNVQASVSRELTQESRSALDATTAGDRADLTVDRATVAVNHRFNRLAL